MVVSFTNPHAGNQSVDMAGGWWIGWRYGWWLVGWRWIVFGDMAGGVPLISARCVAIYFLAANLQIHFLTNLANHQPTSSCHLLPSCYEEFSDPKCLKIACSRNFPHKNIMTIMMMVMETIIMIVAQELFDHVDDLPRYIFNIGRYR